MLRRRGVGLNYMGLQAALLFTTRAMEVKQQVPGWKKKVVPFFEDRFLSRFCEPVCFTN